MFKRFEPNVLRIWQFECGIFNILMLAKFGSFIIIGNGVYISIFLKKINPKLAIAY